MGLRAWFSSFFGKLFAEREVYVRSEGSVRYITLTTTTQVMIAGATAMVLGGLLFLGARSIFFEAHPVSDEAAYAELRLAYEEQLGRLRDRYGRLEAELEASERRFDEELARVAAGTAALSGDAEIDAVVRRRLEESRRRLESITEQRDETLARLEELRLSALEMERRMAEAQRLAAERQASLADFAATLDETTSERDEARGRVRTLSGEVSRLTERVDAIRTHQAQVMAQLEEATRESMSALREILERTGVDVDGLIEEIERTYSGQGGPFVPLIRRAPNLDLGGDPAFNEERVATLLGQMQRLNAMRIAVERLPLANPLGDAPYRFTSGFGPRRHPVTRAMSMHYGIDFAAPQGTPVYAPVGGQVTFAGVQRGYGNVVKIRHSLGYSTVYAHLHRIHVSDGQSVDRMELIGEVGTTGRSTGNHLHYEVRRYREPLNALNFIEAGRDVF